MNAPVVPDAGLGVSLEVSETFISLQGEGVSSGAPAAFLRLARCNLACGFCDTPYTWDFEQHPFEDEVSVRSGDELTQWLRSSSPGRLVITGGEPLIQQKRLLPLLARWAEEQVLPIVEVETNGTILPLPPLAGLVAQWNVSPKLASSGEPRERRLKPSTLTWFGARETAYFKFVVTSEADVREALEVCAAAGVPRQRVLFMPEARTAETLRARAGQVAGWAVRERVRYSGRLHLELFGARRGV